MNFAFLPTPIGRCNRYHAGYQQVLPEDLRRFVLARGRHRCQICRRARAVHVDHIWPRRYGGTDDPANLQAACKPCNSAKRDSLPVGVLPLFSVTGGEPMEVCKDPHWSENRRRRWFRLTTERRWVNGEWRPPLVDVSTWGRP